MQFPYTNSLFQQPFPQPFPNNTMPVTIRNQTHKEQDMSYIDKDNKMVVNMYGNRRRIAARLMPTSRTEFTASTASFPSIGRETPPKKPQTATAKCAMSWSQIAARPPPAPAPPPAPKKPETPIEIKVARSAVRTSSVAQKLRECAEKHATHELPAEGLSEDEDNQDVPTYLNWGDYPEDPVREAHE